MNIGEKLFYRLLLYKQRNNNVKHLLAGRYGQNELIQYFRH